jgi:hypothetical protein
MQGCASPSCTQYLEHLNACSDKILVDTGTKIDLRCTLGAPNQCTTGQMCIQPQGELFASCFQPGEVHKTFKELAATGEQFCNSVFASRQNKYMRCVIDAGCDAKKASVCEAQMLSLTKKAQKEGETGGFLVSLVLFFLLTSVLGGAAIFVLMKLIDGQNPKNTVFRALGLAGAMALFTYPIVYLTPLLGLLLTSSILFGVVMIVYQQGAFLSVAVTAANVLWVSTFFNYVTSQEIMHARAWLEQPEHFRREVGKKHSSLLKAVEELEQERKNLAQALKRAEEAKKKAEEEAKKKAEEEAKKKKAEEDAKKEE